LLEPVEDLRLKVGAQEREHAPVADACLDLVHQRVVGNTVEVAFQIGVHHPVAAGLEGGVDLP
jgi:hypothetical protein